MSNRILPLLLLLILLQGVLHLVQGAPPHAIGKGSVTKRRMPVKLEIRLPKQHFVLGEQIDVEARLTNTGDTAVEVPALASETNLQPIYRLTGPGLPAGGEELGGRSAARRAAHSDVKPELRTVAPGDTLEDGFALQTWHAVNLPGEYTLAARLEWGGWSAESEAVHFTVEANRFITAELAVDVGASSARLLRATWIGQTPSGGVVGQAFFYESRPDLGEMKRTGLRSIGRIGAKAEGPFAPFTNFDRASGFVGWHGWRDAHSLFAVSIGAEQPEQLPLGTPPLRLLRPALMASAGDLNLFVISPDGHELRFLRFVPPPSSGSARTPASILWSMPLPEAAVAGRSALGSPKAGSHRQAVIVTQKGPSLGIHFLDAKDGTGPGKLRSATVEKGYALSESEPALHADETGCHAAVIVATDEKRTTFAVLDVTFPIDAAAPPKVQITSLGHAGISSDKQLLAATAAFGVTPGSPPRREWLLLLQGDRVIHSERPEKPQKLPAPPALPLNLLRMSATTYLLLLSEDKGPFLHPLRH